MASLDELREALVESLETKGVMGELRARIHKEIFEALDDAEVARPRPPRDNVIINELIREYLDLPLRRNAYPGEKNFEKNEIKSSWKCRKNTHL